MSRVGFWGTLLGYSPPRERFSLEELRHLHETLIRNSVVTDSNRDVVVETLRSLAELMIWGDQHEPRFFDYFAENNVLQHFAQFLQKRSNRRGDVAVQVLQTLSILIQNIRSQVAVFYLFSNNHVNDIVALRFDFDDDEVLGYYINLLKTISLKLNESTVQFFFFQLLAVHLRVLGLKQDGPRPSFPLYIEAIKFINHRDGLVRAAVRTLTLNVYSVKEPAVQDFLLHEPASVYFKQLTLYLADQCQNLDRQLSVLGASASSSAVASLDSCLGEIEDLLTYCDDILATGEPRLREILQEQMWTQLAMPILLQPVQTLQYAEGFSQGTGQGPKVQPLTALYILERLLHVTRASSFTHRLAEAFILPISTQQASLAGKQQRKRPQDSEPLAERLQNGELATGLGLLLGEAEQEGGSEPQGEAGVRLEPSAAGQPLLLAALSSSHGPMAAAAAQALLAMMHNCTQGGGEHVLDRAGLLPHRLRRNRELMEALTASSSEALADDEYSGEPGPATARSSMPEADERPTPPTSRQEDSDIGQCQHTGKRSRREGLNAQWVEALCLICAMHVLSPSALAVAGCLLMQLISSGAEMSGRHKALLGRAGKGVSGAVRQEIGSQWCDALMLLTCLLWAPCRTTLASPGLRSTNSAIQYWVDASKVEDAARSGYLAPESGSNSSLPGSVEGASARAAQRAHHTVSRFVLLLQIQEGLMGPQIGDAAPMEQVTESVIRAAETREGAVVLLPDAIPCSVSFTRGAEKSVLLGVHGLPQLPEHGAPENPLAVIGSAAAVVLATPGEQPYTGTAISVAPLLGAAPFVDKAHPRWLHLHVRPHARGLAKTVRSGGQSGALQQIATQLVDGHWVLSFADAGMAHAAQNLVQRCASSLRERFVAALESTLEQLSHMA